MRMKQAPRSVFLGSHVGERDRVSGIESQIIESSCELNRKFLNSRSFKPALLLPMQWPWMDCSFSGSGVSGPGFLKHRSGMNGMPTRSLLETIGSVASCQSILRSGSFPPAEFRTGTLLARRPSRNRRSLCRLDRKKHYPGVRV